MDYLSKLHPVNPDPLNPSIILLRTGHWRVSKNINETHQDGHGEKFLHSFVGKSNSISVLDQMTFHKMHACGSEKAWLKCTMVPDIG